VAVTYVIHFDVVPEKLDRFVHLLNGVLDAMRAGPSFHEAVTAS
jgi:(4S)-4-hydroxy-5-phosphonooxypentane-2,3-dione isomerase